MRGGGDPRPSPALGSDQTRRLRRDRSTRTGGNGDCVSGRCDSNRAAVVGPMQQSLALPRPAKNIAALAVTLDLPQVPAHRLPPLDLAQVLVLHAAAHIIAAIPLEPAARVVGVNPTLLAPNGQRLARVDAEEVERSIAAVRRKLSAGEPAFGKLVSRVGQVLAPKH